MEAVETILVVIVFGLLASVVVLAVALFRRPALLPPDFSPLAGRIDSVDRGVERTERSLRDEFARNRDTASTQANSLRLEVHRYMEVLGNAVGDQIATAGLAQVQQLERVTLEMAATRRATEDRLEQIRRTVDEQLQGTLEKRLGESFRLVSERLEQVYKGLGEMQTLAAGVGDLKRVFSDVRARGAWGEIQLGALLEQMLAPDQYGRNVATGGTCERVEFAIKMPGPEAGGCVWLPIDAKFPQEDYLRLVEASERCDAEALELCARQLEARVKACAREISSKYVHPPPPLILRFCISPLRACTPKCCAATAW